MMENTVKVEGFVRDLDDTVLARNNTPVVIITLEHHRQGRFKLHTPWFRVFFLNEAYADAKVQLANGKRVTVTGSLDTTSYKEGDSKIRRTYINGKSIEVMA